MAANNSQDTGKHSKRGGARKGAGRKPKAEEDRVRGLCIAAITDVYGSEEAGWKYIAEKSRESFPHLRMLMEYTYGKPKERQEISLTAEQPLFPDIL